MERVLRQLSDSFIREKGKLMVPLSRFSLNRPTASLKKGSSPFRGENFRCYSTCFSSNLELDKGETCIPSQGRSKMIAPVVDFLGSLPPLIYTHLFSLRFRWTTSSVNNRNGRCRRNWKIHVRAGTDRADSSECKYRPNNRTPSLLLKKE